jgi:hypothetical protein
VERAAWTDERLDDLAATMRQGFDRMDRDIRDTRAELHEDIRGTRAELTAQIEALRQTMVRVGGGMLLGFISVLAAILARGA